MKLFTSATLKLAGWYLLILMTVSLLFSGIIFAVARSEVDARLHGFAIKRGLLDPDTAEAPLNTREQMEKAEANLISSLTYINLIVLFGGGICAYLLARRTLAPIEAAHEAQSRFVANASHQLRTPLAIMKAETELLLNNHRSTKTDLRHTLASNLEEVDRLTELTTMLLELSRSEGALSSTTESFDLVALMTQLIASRPGGERVALTAPQTLAVTLHRPALREILAILFDNAVKHSPAATPITIAIARHKHNVHIVITNTGEGITKADLPHIFERFYRGHQRNDSYGLGLSLAHQLTKALGGSISATSTPGDTTTFTLIVPGS